MFPPSPHGCIFIKQMTDKLHGDKKLTEAHFRRGNFTLVVVKIDTFGGDYKRDGVIKNVVPEVKAQIRKCAGLVTTAAAVSELSFCELPEFIQLILFHKVIN